MNERLKPLPEHVERRAALLGARIKMAREGRRWTQERLAKTSKLSLEAVQSIESGDVLRTLEEYLCVLWAMDLDASLDRLATVPTPSRTRADLGANR